MEDGGGLRIGELSYRVGVRPDLLRAWERRYGLLAPRRSESGYRMYTERDEWRVRLMLEKLRSGVSTAEAAHAIAAMERDSELPDGAVESPLELAEQLGAALESFDEDGAHQTLDRLLGLHGLERAIRDALMPYLMSLGDRWARREVTVGQEHFASRLLEGRLLDYRDGADAPRAVLVSDAFANRYLQGVNPIGQRIEYRSSGKPAQSHIVGVVRSLRHDRLDAAPRAEILIPFAQSPSGTITVVARTALDPRMLIEPAKAAVWTVDPMQTFYRTATLDELVDRTLVTRRFALIVLTGFVALAMLLAAAGLYGVLSTIASQYRRSHSRASSSMRLTRGAAETKRATSAGSSTRRCSLPARSCARYAS